ncbi:histidine kinase [Streptomyces sp. x-80]|uniref:histidine kinase n=1 Tax=Streptomyces sp. x-80 TaxID=2789282 RepID=UPI00398088F2
MVVRSASNRDSDKGTRRPGERFFAPIVVTTLVRLPPKRKDFFLAIGCAVLASALVVVNRDALGGVQNLWVKITAVLAVSVLVFFRRRVPFIFSVGAVAAYAITSQELVLSLAAYTAARIHRHRPSLMLIAVPMALILIDPTHLLGYAPNARLNIYEGATAVALPFLLGQLLNALEGTAELESRSFLQGVRLERSHRAQERLASRARLARKIHDGIGHDVSLMTLRAGAIADHPDATDEIRTLCQSIIDTGKATSQHMRQILDVLSTQSRNSCGPDEEPGQSMADLADLVRKYQEYGLSIHTEVNLSGETHRMCASLQLVYRVTAEALSNVTRYASSSQVMYWLRQNNDTLLVTIENTEPKRTPPWFRGTGHGLSLLKRDIEQAGGTFTARPTADNGYRVEACIPMSDSSEA